MTHVHKDSSICRQIQKELDSTSRLVRRIERRSAEVLHAKPDYLTLMRAAGYLYSFYFGLVKIFKLIASHIDQLERASELGDDELLHQMTAEIHGARPAILNAQLASQLADLRRCQLLLHRESNPLIEWSILIPKIGDVRMLFNQIERVIGEMLMKLEKKGTKTDELD